MGTKLNYKMQLKLDPRNAIPVLEMVPNLLVSEIFKRLTTSAQLRVDSYFQSWQTKSYRTARYDGGIAERLPPR